MGDPYVDARLVDSHSQKKQVVLLLSGKAGSYELKTGFKGNTIFRGDKKALVTVLNRILHEVS